VERAIARTTITGVALILAVAGAASAQQADDAQVRARQRISMMEGTLERAVSIGAENLLRRMRTVTPEAPMLSGIPQVRGFRLDGYGVFFDVGVPLMRLPVTWPLRYMSRSNRDLEVLADDFRSLMSQSRLDPQSEQRFGQWLRRLEVQAQGPGVLRNPAVPVASTAAQAAPGPAAGQTLASDPLLDDPNEGYTQEIKAALIDAMIENSGPLVIGPDEWLTVAARDNVPRDPLVPGDTADFSTLIFRLRGSDLAAFRAGKMTLEEARQKVDVREY
jgi:hypothetical protein